MFNENLFFFKFLMQFNLNLLLLSSLVVSVLFVFSKLFSIQLISKTNSVFFYTRYLLIVSLIVSFLIHILTLWFYIFYTREVYNQAFFNDLMLSPTMSLFYNYNLNLLNFFPIKIYFSMDLFGFILLSLAYIVGFFSLLALDNRLFYKNIKYLYYFNLFLIIVFLYVSVSNIIFFFFLYECLLLPSFLIVYFVSPSRRATQASLYFVIWTQVGSLFVLCEISYIITVASVYDFAYLKIFVFTKTEVFWLFFLLFFGFGFKVPIWPFHYWLTKTHVEAPAGFSMYLSGFLVKSALYGFYKFSNILGAEISTVFFSSIVIVGCVDASLKMWGQTDLKKLAAYGTIQEMNLIYLVFLLGDANSILGGMLFCFAHAFLSMLMFYIVDCVQRRFHSRSVVELSGILNVTPNLGICILGMCICYAGLPGTLKFISEFYIFVGLVEVSPLSCFLLMFICNVLGLIGFSKCWFNVTFGMMSSNVKYLPIDLTIKELFIIISCFLFLFFSVFFINILF